jgi:hypothetical protein
MKKLILSVSAIIIFTMASQAQVIMGIKAGGNLNNQRISASTGSLYAGDKFKGYHAGILAEIPLGANFYLQPQVLFAKKGATHLSSVNNFETKVRLSYIELPANIIYKSNIPIGNLFIGTGASFSYAVGGNEQYGDVTKKLYSGPVKNWERKDINLNFTAGLELTNGLFVSANWQKGMMDIYKPADASIKNKSFSVSVGYLIK